MTARLSPDASNRVYVPEIDGLRAIAVGAVLLYHLNAAFLPGGFTGVDVFFVISGYVVSASLGRDLQRAFPDFLMHFYARRMMRILPALLVCLLVTALATALLIPNAWLSDSIHKTGLYAFFGVSNYALVGSDPYFAPRPEFNPFTHTWSLAVEEQFYLLYPILFFAAARVKSTRLLLAILTISSLVYAAWISRASPEAAFYLLPSRFWELGAGALLYQLQAARKLPESLVKPVLPIGLGLILLAMMFAGREGVPFPWAVPAVLGAWLVLASVSSGTAASDPIARALRSGIMVWIGKLSYSLYLWHWPIYSLFRWTVGLEGLMGLVAVAMTVIIATLSFFWVEQPFRVASWLKAHAKAWVVVGGLVSVLLTWGVGREIFKAQPTLSLSQVTQEREKWYPGSWPQFDAAPGCPLALQHGSVGDLTVLTVRRHCPTPASTWKRLFVLGDSHTGAYTAMLLQLARQDDVELRILSKGGCPVATLLRPATEECRLAASAGLAEIRRTARVGDIVLLASLRTDRMGDQSAAFSEATMSALRYSEAAAVNRRVAYQEAVAILDDFTKAGLRVIMDAPKPVFRAPAFRCSDWFNRMHPICQNGLSIPRAELEEHRRPVVGALTALAAAYPGLRVWDPFPILCPSDPCQARTRSGPLFFDGDHLSGFGNQVLFPHFQLAMRGFW
jgi:peptidoglycan/LPS O-acetylase OafA/YrhL